MQQSDASRVRI